MKRFYIIILFVISLMLISAACEEDDGHPITPPVTEDIKWRLVDSTNRMYYEDVFFVDEYYGWAVGMRTSTMYAHSIAYTNDGGWHWDYYYYHPDFNAYSMNSVFFIDRNEGWVCGTSGIILHTTDGGRTWAQQQTNVSSNLQKITFKDNLNGRAVGDNSTMLFTNNGGASWSTIGLSSMTQTHLKDVAFSYYKVVAIGWYSKPQFFLADDGVNFYEYQINTYTSPGLMCNSLAHIDHQNIWVAGQYGFIGKTEDEGHTWISQNSGVTEALYDIFFLDKNYGWAVGRKSTLLNTNNGGSTWSKTQFDREFNFNSVFFIDNEHGWVVADHHIYKYSDEY